jgi:SAM-dependent methyltransferase
MLTKFEGKLQYVLFHKERFIFTIKQINKLIKNTDYVELLEIGPEDYFFTSLIKELFKDKILIECVEHPDALKSNITIKKPELFKTNYINLEKEKLLTNKKYDLIICCEVIEHLLNNPSRFLNNIAYLLKKDGFLLITTDNVCRLSNILKLILNKNVFFYIQPTPIFRHNREYTMSEMEDLLQGNSFKIISKKYFNFFPKNNKFLHWGLKTLFFPTVFLRRYKRHMIFVCQHDGSHRLYYPNWLYEYPREMEPID